MLMRKEFAEPPVDVRKAIPERTIEQNENGVLAPVP
jgi:hypothetical protein